MSPKQTPISWSKLNHHHCLSNMGEIIDCGSISYTHKWVNSTSELLTRREARPTDIHKACIRVFKLFLRHLPELSTFQIDAGSTANAREELGRLYLWDESFYNGGLDKTLEQSDEVRDNVFELLRGIGGILLRGNFRSSSTYCLLGISTSSDKIKNFVSLSETRSSAKLGGKQDCRSS